MLPQRKTTLDGRHTNELSEGNKPASRKSAPPQEGSRELLPLTPPPLATDYGDELWVQPAQQGARR
jgi:hypothetical protein